MPQKKTQASARPCGKRETAHRSKVRGALVIGEFRDDGHDRAAFKRFFHGPEHIASARHREHEHSIHRKPETIETRTIERPGFGARERALDPKHLPASRVRKRSERERKTRRRAAMSRKSWSKLVQRAKRKPAVERVIDRRNAQAQRMPGSIC